MAKSRSSLRPLALAVGVTLLLVVPFGVVLLREGGGVSIAPGAGRSAGATTTATTTAGGSAAASSSSANLALAPPAARPAGAPPAPRQPAADFPPVETTVEVTRKPTKPASVRMVAIHRLVRKRPEETIDLAEALVRDVAGDPAERTVLLSALGVLHQVPGGEQALVRLSDDPPTPEVGALAADYLMRPR